MKKVLSLVLVLSMILGCFSFAFAAETTKKIDFSDVKDSDEFAEAVTVLVGFEVVSGFPDKTFRPGDTVTRAQMCSFIINAMNLKPAANSSTKFDDVPYTHWASGYIAYANSLGVIAGRSETVFDPDAIVSYDEAVTMLVKALGYTAESLTGGYPAAFVSQAKALGILDHVTKTGSVGANRGDIAMLVYDTLDCEIGHIDKDGNFEPTTAGDSMLKRLGAKPYLEASTGKPTAFVVDGSEDALINMNKYLGQYVTAYCNKAGEIVTVTPYKFEFVEGKHKKTTTDYKIGDYYIDITGVATAATNDLHATGMSYEKVDSEGTKVGGSGTTTGIYKYFINGELKTADDGKVPVAVSSSPYVEYTVAAKVSGSYLKEIYSMMIWDTEEGGNHGRVDDDDLADLADKELLGEDFALDDEDNIDYDSFALVGVDSLEDIKADNVVYVYSKPTSKKISKIEVGTETIEAAVSKIKYDSGDIDTVTINGNAYSLASVATSDAQNITADSEGIFYLDYDGDIYDFEATNSKTDYAVVVGYSTGGGNIDNDKLQLIIADGSKPIYVLGDSCKDDSGSDVNSITGISVGDIVKYHVDKNGEFDKLTLIAGYNDPDEAGKFASIGASGAEISKKGIIEDTAYKVTDDTLVVYYDGTTSTTDDKTKYSFGTVSGLLGNEAKEHSYYALDKGTVKAIVAWGVAGNDDVYTVGGGEYIAVNESAEGYPGQVTMIYDGAAKLFYVKDGLRSTIEDIVLADCGKTTTAAFNTTNTTYEGFRVYTLKLDENGAIKDIEDALHNVDGLTTNLGSSESAGRVKEILLTTTTKTALNGLVLKTPDYGNPSSSEYKYYELSDDVAVFAMKYGDDDYWTAKKPEFLGGKSGSPTKTAKMVLFDIDDPSSGGADGVWDVVFYVYE